MMFFVFLLLSFSLFAHDHGCIDTVPQEVKQMLALQEHLGWHSATEREVAQAPCTRKTPFTDEEMKNWMANHSSDKKVNRTINGIHFEGESEENLLSFQYLTTALDFFGRKDSKRQKQFSSSCKKVQCAVDEIFGKETGTQILFLHRKYGMNASHFSNDNSHPWRKSDLNQIMMGLADFPDGLLPVSNNKPLVRYKGTKPKGYETAIADSHIRIYTEWGSQSTGDKRITVAHELGHVLAQSTRLDTSPLWMNMSGWSSTRKMVNGKIETVATALNQNAMVSAYGSKNHMEDMADSVLAYRYNPKRLLAASPEKYSLIRNTIFDGVEYTSEAACRNPQRYSKKVESYANQLAQKWTPSEKDLPRIVNKCSALAIQQLGTKNIDLATSPFRDCYEKSINEAIQAFVSVSTPKHAHTPYLGAVLRNIKVKLTPAKMNEALTKAQMYHRDALRADLLSGIKNNPSMNPDDCTVKNAMNSSYNYFSGKRIQINGGNFIRPLENASIRACSSMKSVSSIRRTLGLDFSEEEMKNQINNMIK